MVLLQPEEEFFVCKWSTNTTTGAPLLLLAGFTGSIRVVDCNLRKVVWVRDNALHDILQSTQQCMWPPLANCHLVQAYSFDTL